MSAESDAVDPERYHPESNIRQYLVSQSANAIAPEMLGAAVHERWIVKTAGDADAQALTGQAPTPTTITELRALPIPPLLPPDGRSDGAEKTVWQLTATLQAFRGESDGDYHLVIGTDVVGETMIAEIPNPSDITDPSYFADQIASARSAFDNYFQITEGSNGPAAAVAPQIAGESEFREVTIPVTITGLGFFDFNHRQRGVAPNAIELHPVINIVFNS
jgi:hypothetical protein